MLTRRDLLKNAAGVIAGVGAGLSRLEGEQGAAGRRPLMVGGRRIKVIDVHAHCVVPGAMELVGRTTPATGPLLLGPERLPHMDAQGIDVEVLSINPFWYAAERDVAEKVVALQNQKLSEFCRAYSDRFAALATVAMQHPDLAAAQLEDGVTRLGLKGGSLGATVNGEELANPRFDVFWAKAEALGAPIFIHPQGVPELGKRLQGNGFLGNVIGNPLETTIALSHLIFEGTLDRFPRLKICAAHGGGYLPSYADRSDNGCRTFPDQCKPIKRRPTEYLKEIYVDSLVFSGEALRHLVAVSGADKVVIGTDYPFPWTTTAVDHVLNAPGLSDADRIAILGGNATRLLGLSV